MPINAHIKKLNIQTVVGHLRQLHFWAIDICNKTMVTFDFLFVLDNTIFDSKRAWHPHSKTSTEKSSVDSAASCNVVLCTCPPGNTPRIVNVSTGPDETSGHFVVVILGLQA